MRAYWATMIIDTAPIVLILMSLVARLYAGLLRATRVGAMRTH